MGHPMRLELTRVGLLVELANHYTTTGEGRLVVADVAVKSFKFQLIAVYAPNTTVERVSFFCRLVASLNG